MEKIWIILLGVAGIVAVCLLNKKNTVFRTVGCIAVLLGCIMGLLIYFNVSYFESVRTIILTITLTVILLVLVYMILIVAGNYIKRKQTQAKRSFQATSEKAPATGRRKGAPGHRRQAEPEEETVASELEVEQPVATSTDEAIAEPQKEYVAETAQEPQKEKRSEPEARKIEEKEPLVAAKEEPATKEKVTLKEEPLYAAGGKPQPDGKEGTQAMAEDKVKVKSELPKAEEVSEKQPAIAAEEPGIPGFDVFLKPRTDEEPASLVEHKPADVVVEDAITAGAASKGEVEVRELAEAREDDKFSSFETFLLPDVDEETGVYDEELADEEPFEPFEFADDEEMREESEEAEKKISVSLDDAAARFAQWQSGITEEEETLSVMENVADIPAEEESGLWEVAPEAERLEEWQPEEDLPTELYGEAEAYEPESGIVEEEQLAAIAMEEPVVEEYALPEEEPEEVVAEPWISAEPETPEEYVPAEPEMPVEPEMPAEPEVPEEPGISEEPEEPESYEGLDPHERKQAEMGRLRKLVAQKDYSTAIQQVFKILNAGYVMTPDEKQQMKLILLTLKEKTKR